ncbi:hypothetical protein D0866_16436, partial [Hortaea werneckii]
MAAQTRFWWRLLLDLRYSVGEQLDLGAQVLGVAENALTHLFSSVGFDVSAGSDDGYLPQCIEMDSVQFGLVSSIFTLGGFLGALCGGPATTQYGRLKAMIVSGILAAIGPAFEALANSIGFLITGRLIAGLGAGAATVIVPIYISEIAPPYQKGFFGSFTQVMINVGILITQTLGLFLSRGQFWRIILGVGGAIAALQVVCLVLGGQESPKWLADNGKPSRAKRTLRKLRGHQANIDEEVVGWGLESERDMEDEE